MKIWLDDIREAPQGFIRCYWPDEVITCLKTNKVTYLSLDHDLGNDNRGTGYDVLLWIEENVVINDFIPPSISVHSANPIARIRMEKAIRSIKRLCK